MDRETVKIGKKGRSDFWFVWSIFRGEPLDEHIRCGQPGAGELRSPILRLFSGRLHHIILSERDAGEAVT